MLNSRAAIVLLCVAQAVLCSHALKACSATRPIGQSVVSQPRAAKKLVRILLLGDSSTLGYVPQPADCMHPYSIQMQAVLAQTNKFDLSITNAALGALGATKPPFALPVFSCAVCTATFRATSPGTARYPVACKQYMNGQTYATCAATPFDVIVVLSGVKDISASRSADEITKVFFKFYADVLKTKATLVSIQPFQQKSLPKNSFKNTQRVLLQKKTEAYAAAARKKGQKLWTFSTDRKELDQYAMTPQQRDQLYADAIHLTPTGYDTVGTLLGQELLKLPPFK